MLISYSIVKYLSVLYNQIIECETNCSKKQKIGCFLNILFIAVIFSRAPLYFFSLCGSEWFSV